MFHFEDIRAQRDGIKDKIYFSVVRQNITVVRCSEEDVSQFEEIYNLLKQNNNKYIKQTYSNKLYYVIIHFTNNTSLSFYTLIPFTNIRGEDVYRIYGSMSHSY